MKPSGDFGEPFSSDLRAELRVELLEVVLK